MLQTDAKDTENFDQEFTREAPADSYVDGPVLSQTMQDQFTVVLDKKRVSNANMQKFVTDALAAGAKMPA